MNKWIMRHILYKPMKKHLDRKLIEQGGFRGEANDLYCIMWHLALTGVFTEEQKEDLRQAVPYRGPKRPATKVKVRRVSRSCAD